MPKLQGTPNKLDELGQAAGGATIDFDQVKSLDLAQKLFLLEKASLKPSLAAAAAADAPASGDMPALILTAGTLALSSDDVGAFGQVDSRSPPKEQEYTAGTSYSEFESNLQRQSVTETTATIGMPSYGIFKVDASYNAPPSTRHLPDQQIEIFVHASRVARKAEILFTQDKLSLAPELVRRSTTCAAGMVAEAEGRPPRRTREVWSIRANHIFMGGRLTLLHQRKAERPLGVQLGLARFVPPGKPGSNRAPAPAPPVAE